MNSQVNPCINSITYSRAMARQLGLQEKDIWRLLAGTRLTVHRFLYDDSPISYRDQLQIFSNCLSLSGDPAFGLKLGQTLTPSTHGAMGFLSNCSPTLRTALEDFSKFLPTRVDFGRLTLVLDGEYINCNMEVIADGEPVYRLIAEAFALSLCNLIEQISGAPLTDADLCFSFPRPPYWQRYGEHLRCRLHFGAGRNQLRLPIAMGEIPNVASDFQTYRLYKEQCQKQLSDMTCQRSTTAERVRKILLTAPPDRHLTEADIASAMFISKRTLARRLQSEGVGFRQLREEVMISLAMSYLAESDLPVDRIASLLCYHDSSSFRRAFKRVTGKAPLAFRAEARVRRRPDPAPETAGHVAAY